MTLLLLGLLLLLGGHSIRIIAPGWRTAQVARFGELRWRAAFALVALAGLVLIVHGYGAARLAAPLLWQPPLWTRHVAALLTLPAFVLLVAAYVPGNRIKAALGHPMVAGVKLWALAHLLANGSVADLLLSGSFLAWAVASFVTARRRDRRAGTSYPAGPLARDVATVAGGLLAWGLFAFWLHGPLIGVRPFG